MSLTPESVKTVLRAVIDPDSGHDVVSAGMISGVVVREGKVGLVLTIDPKDKDRKAGLSSACEAEIKKLPGVENVTVVLTAQNSEPIPPKPETGYTQPRERAVWNLTPLDGVKRVIAVASGKGGVGKSTTSVNLALALQKTGQRVGLLDADIYGPSLPRMLGLSGQPDIIDGKMVPLQSHGIQCMSMGFITGDEAAILRGPMISKSLQQLLRFSRWDNLDTLLVDMPPGTGDIHISMVQQVPLAGAIIVTTPQEVAVIDARKCLKMFQKVNTPILGVVENMSGSIFGSGGGKRLADEMAVPFLGAITMDEAICTATDNGQAYAGDAVSAYDTIAKTL
jgi:ATP-binding protein involved in chromosome partitioning